MAIHISLNHVCTEGQVCKYDTSEEEDMGFRDQSVSRSFIFSLMHHTSFTSQLKLQKWIKYFKKISHRLSIKFKGGEDEFCEQLYMSRVKFPDGHDSHNSELDANTVFEEALASLNKYQSKFNQCSSVILEISGRGAEYDMVEEKLGQVSRVVKHVEEMFCAVMEDPKTLISAHGSGSLAYQVK